MHRAGLSLTGILVLCTVLIFQNCTPSANFGSAEKTSAAGTLVTLPLSESGSGSGNGGGYGGKPFIEIAAPGDCAIGVKVKARLVLLENGEATMTQENCTPIVPRVIAKSRIRIQPTLSTIDVDGRAFVSEAAFDVRLACSYLTSTTSEVADERMLIAETSTGPVALVHRSIKSTSGYIYQASAPESVRLQTVPGQPGNLEYLASSGPTGLSISPFSEIDFTMANAITTNVSYSLSMMDLTTGVGSLITRGPILNTRCLVYR